MKAAPRQDAFYTVALLAALLVSRPGTAQAKPNAGPVGANPAIRMCAADDLSLGTDDENGSFNGMSHSGTLLVLRNLSPTACRVPQRPDIRFLDDANKSLPVTLEIAGAKFMHPGPVLVPVVVAPEAEVTAKLRWVSGEVYDQSVCANPAALAVTVQGGKQQVPFKARICGDKTKSITFSATPFAVDPQFKP